MLYPILIIVSEIIKSDTILFFIYNLQQLCF